VIASVRVSNTGERRGTETVHLYYQDLVCEERVPRLLERLGHRQVTLDPGETATLAFTVTADMLAKCGRDPDAGRKVWPDRVPEENPDRLFIVRHEGEALDAIERFGDAPSVLTFTLVP
jgi:beta-glucosidase